jgi:two-component system chemotaxis sensor kinase CheA
LDKLLQKVVEMEQAYEEILETEKKLGGAGGDGDTLVQISERKLEHIDKVARTLSVGAGLSDPEAVRPLLDACVRLRDVALPRLADKYRSMLERVAEKLGKQISFECAPHHLEVDPHFFAPIDEALIHILRNSVDHGLESPADRVSAGKPEVGTILLQVVPNDDYVNVILKDDGGGIDADRVVRKAIEEQVITADDAASMSMEQKLGLIFESGVSTAAEVSDISGRGVGMAAVRECIEGLGGSIVLRSEVGKGTELTLQLPARFLRS